MMRGYPHPEDLGLVDDHPDPLSVFCPLCLACPGDPCEEVRLGWITAAPEPHPIRVRAAEEVARG